MSINCINMGKIMKYFLILLVLFSMPVSAEVYKWTDDSGRIHYSDKGRTNKAVESIEVKVNSYKHLANELVPGRDARDKKESKKVIMYSTSWCGYCAKARKYFNSNNIKFTEYDIEKSKKARRQYDAIGGRGVPVILVAKKRMNGFSIDRFNRIYQ